MDPTIILLVVAFGAFIVFQTFQGRKRKRETEDRQTKFVPGVEIMTNYGLYGTIVSIDDDKNIAVIESTPGTQLLIHRQTILKVADYNDVPAELDDSTDADAADADDLVLDADADAADRDASTADRDRSAQRADESPIIMSDEPEYGQRVDPDAKPNRPDAV
ncbi:preprotein translocase subunit YajC [Marisediminicola senii]|uniref:preprotein translocase subunit YajC n=1 Tax=Marisediminicola senii TaxID=2711233 RepID=UPI0013E9C9F4|nr:preprotein translocase subunit YajC [Marisediminicola senii]